MIYTVTVPTAGTQGEAAQVLLNPRGIGPYKGIVNAFAGAVETPQGVIQAPAAGQPGESRSTKSGSLVNPDYGIGIGRVAAGSSFTFEMMPPGGSTMPVGVVLAPAFVKLKGTLLYNGGSTVPSTPNSKILGLTPQ